MADFETPPAPVERHIHWGGVVKGVAIVAAIAVAAVVGFWLLSAASTAVTGYIGAHAGTSALAAGAHTGLVATEHFAGWAVGSVGHLLAGVPAGLAHILGLTGQHFAQAAAVNHVVGIGGAAVAGAIATHAAMPYLQHTHYVDVDPSAHTEAGMLASSSVPLHDITHMTHHAAEHADEHHAHNWAQKFAPQANASASYADSVRTSKPAGSFTEQLNADRANLDLALAK